MTTPDFFRDLAFLFLLLTAGYRQRSRSCSVNLVFRIVSPSGECRYKKHLPLHSVTLRCRSLQRQINMST